MRIALASIHPRPLSGQIEGLVGLAQALENQGHSVQLVSAFPTRDLLSNLRYKLATRPRWMFMDEPFRLMGILGDLARLASKVDVIQLNLPTPAFSIIGDMLARLVCTPVVIGFEAHLVKAEELLRLDRLSQAPEFYIPRLLINNRLVAGLARHHAAHYVVSSKYQEQELVGLGVQPNRIRRLPNRLPRDKLTRSTRVTSRAGFPDGRLLTYVGHYNHVKGVDVLVRAFEKLAPGYPDLKLILAWSGLGANRRIEQWRRESGLNDRLVQMGRVCVPDLLAASDVVALPYRLTIGQAAYPATLLEALAANVPVVTSDLPLLRELTRDGKTALLARPEDPDDLAASIECLMTEPELVRQMLEAQRRWRQQMHPEIIVREYEALYTQVIGRELPVLAPAGGSE